jgi:hypothetical protein
MNFATISPAKVVAVLSAHGNQQLLRKCYENYYLIQKQNENEMRMFVMKNELTVREI